MISGRIQSKNSSAGVIYIGTVVMVLLLFSLMAYTMGNIISINSQKTASQYGSAEAELLAQAGIEYAYYKLEENFIDWNGTSGEVSFAKGSFNVAVYNTDENGAALNADQKRIISTGTLDQSRSKIQATFSSASEAASFTVFIQELESAAVNIASNNTLEGNFYFASSVNVGPASSNISSTAIYSPSASNITFDDNNNAGLAQTYPAPVPVFPTFDTFKHDSLLTIAVKIKNSRRNLINGDLTINSAWYPADYIHRTVFIKGDLTVTGSAAVIPSGTITQPTYIVVDGNIVFDNGCSFGDNIITIASGSITISGAATRYGIDVSGTAVSDRPARINELASTGNIIIDEADIFSNVEAQGNISLTGRLVGTLYANGSVNIDAAVLEGSIMARSAAGDLINNSILKYAPSSPSSSTGALKPSIIPGSWKVL